MDAEYQGRDSWHAHDGVGCTSPERDLHRAGWFLHAGHQILLTTIGLVNAVGFLVPSCNAQAFLINFSFIMKPAVFMSYALVVAQCTAQGAKRQRAILPGDSTTTPKMNSTWITLLGSSTIALTCTSVLVGLGDLTSEIGDW